MKRYFIYIILILLIVIRYTSTRPHYKSGDTIKISGIIYSDPLKFSNSQYTKLGGLRIYLPKKPEVEYGDTVIVIGKLQGEELKNAKVISVSSGSSLSTFRNKVAVFYLKNLPQPESGLLAGIVFGARGAMTPDFYNSTKSSGLFHIVIPSGIKTTFIIGFLVNLFAYLFKRKVALVFVISSLVLYIFMIGFDAPILRAVLMSLCAFSAELFGRKISKWRIFFVAAAIMLVIIPEFLVDIGFYISFASVAALMLYATDLAKLLKALKFPKLLIENLAASLAAQFGAAPLLYLFFNQISFWSPLANLLVLWEVPVVMLLGVIGGVTGLLIPGLGKMFLYLAYPMLWWFVKVSSVFS